MQNFVSCLQEANIGGEFYELKSKIQKIIAS
jgi:hypothetical protein